MANCATCGGTCQGNCIRYTYPLVGTTQPDGCVNVQLSPDIDGPCGPWLAEFTYTRTA